MKIGQAMPVTTSYSNFQDMNMGSTGVGTVPLPSLNAAALRLLDRLYWGIPLPQQPISEKHISKEERNRKICERHNIGERLEDIAEDYNISVQRTSRIIHRWCK